MKIQAKADGNAELYIYGDIGESWWAEESITAKGVVNELQQLDANQRIDVRVNSYGGSVADGLAIYNTLKRHPGGVDVHIDGMAASIASLIAMAGDTVHMADNASLMIHAPWSAQVGNAVDMRDMADTLDKMAASMATTYIAKSNLSEEEVMTLLMNGDDHWFNAREAQELGLVDEITEALPIAAKYQHNRFTKPAASAANHVAVATPITQEVKTMSTEDNAATVDAAELDNVKAEAIEAERTRIAEINAIAAKFEKPELASAAVENGDTVDTFRASLVDVLAKAPKQVKQDAPVAAPTVDIAMAMPHGKSIKGFKTEADAYKAGQFLRAAIWNDSKAKSWLRDQGFNAAAAEGVGTSGGFLVPDEFNQAVIDLREEYGVMRGLVNVKPMARDVMYIPRRAGGLTAYFVAENAAITESDKSWDQVSLTARKMAVLSRMSSEVAEDAIIDVASDLASEIAYAFAEKEDDCILNGDGTSTYGGMIGFRTKIIDGNHTAGAIDAASGNDTYAEITLSDIHKMMAALPQYARTGAAFVVSQSGYSLMLERLMAAAGGNTIGTLEAGVMPRFLGYPVHISQKMPTSTGDLSDVAMLLFGRFDMACTLGDRRGFDVVEDSSRYLEYDQIAVRGTCRMDAVVHDLGDTSTAGPVVALIGE